MNPEAYIFSNVCGDGWLKAKEPELAHTFIDYIFGVLSPEQFLWKMKTLDPEMTQMALDILRSCGMGA